MKKIKKIKKLKKKIEQLKFMYFMRHQQCAQCSALIEEDDVPPHCLDCNVDEDNYFAWQDMIQDLELKLFK